MCAPEGANGQIAVGELAVAAHWNAAVVLESCSAVVAARWLAVDVVVAALELELVVADVVAVVSGLGLVVADVAVAASELELAADVAAVVSELELAADVAAAVSELAVASQAWPVHAVARACFFLVVFPGGHWLKRSILVTRMR